MRRSTKSESGETVNIENRQHRRKTSLATLVVSALMLVTSNAQAVSQTITRPRAPDAKAMMCAELHGNMQKHRIKSQCDNKCGNREDLEDVIYTISPTETPFLTMASRSTATAVLHEWQTDALAAAAGNKQIEGDDASAGNGSTSVPTARLGNYCQIASKYAVVSDTQNAVDKAGRGNEMSYQVAKRLAELKRDIEFALTQNQGSSAGSATVARSTASVESWLTYPVGAAMVGNSTHISTGSTASTTPGWSSGGSILAPTDTTVTGTVIVANLKKVIADCWIAGGNPGIIMCGAVLKQSVSAFAGIATLYREAGSTSKGTAIIGAADVYVSDFGEHRVVPNRFMRATTILVLDMDYWGVAYLRKVSQKEIARTGSAQKRFIDVEFALVAKNPQSSGKIAEALI